MSFDLVDVPDELADRLRNYANTLRAAIASDVDRTPHTLQVSHRSVGIEWRAKAAPRSLPERRPRTRRRWVAPVVALAVIAVVVIGLIAIGTNRNESVGNDPARLRWLLRDLPSGWRPTTVFDSTTAPPHPANPFVMNIYATDSEPVGPNLTVQGTTDASQGFELGSYSGTVLSYEEFTLDGKRAAFATLPDGGRGLYVEINSAWVYMSSRGLSDEELRRLARTLAPDASGHFDVARSALPDGMHKVVSVDDPPRDVVTVDYSPPGFGQQLLELAIQPANRALLAMGSTDYTFNAIAAGDFSGYLGKSTVEDAPVPTTSWIVLWNRDGLDFELRGYGLTSDQVVAAAASAAHASSGTWADLLGSQIVGPGDTAPAGTSPPLAIDTTPSFAGDPRDVAISVTVDDVSANEQRWSGVLPTGESWSAKITRVYDRMDIRYSIDGNLTESSKGMSTAQATGDGQVTCCSPMAITKNPKAVALRALRPNGDRYTIPLHELPGTGGVRVALIALPDSPLLNELIDAKGNVLESYAPH